MSEPRRYVDLSDEELAEAVHGEYFAYVRDGEPWEAMRWPRKEGWLCVGRWIRAALVETEQDGYGRAEAEIQGEVAMLREERDVAEAHAWREGDDG